MAKARAGVGGELSGRVGGLVYVSGLNGTVVRSMPTRRKAPTLPQIMNGERMALASGVWAALSPEAMGRWRAYAEGLAATEPALARSPARAWNAFFALANRVMMIELGATVPIEPPTGFFAGDGVGVTVSGSPSSDGSFGRGGPGERSGTLPPLPQPPLQDEPLGEGALFTADRANAPGIVTELLTQSLANAGRTPVGSKYRSRGFVAFGSELERTVDLPAGWHACAVRFVERATGRATGLFPCGIVRVGGA